MEPTPPDRPRIGLALSGGGFRAAFFHLGVLARLAEAGILPRVEVISTVSGGSIIGAAYYLKVRRLLEESPEAGPSSCDFVNLVWDLDKEMRAVDRQGIRGQLFSNLWKNLRMLSPPLPGLPDYTRTDRLGDLLDRHLYKGLFWPDAPELRDENNPLRIARREKQVELRDLVIRPHGQRLAGKPMEVNEDRTVKIPELVINATCLNTGHLWCFEATRMGEHPRVDSDQTDGGETESSPLPRRFQPDGNRVLRPGYFVRAGEELDSDLNEVPPEQQDFPMALAVAASAAVPGVFSTLPISGMYPKARVQLVDGGVADNQGVQSLIDHHCNHLIISDGSGQMEDQPTPKGKLIPSVSRTMGVQGDRIRDLQLGATGPQMYLVHLREGLVQDGIEPGESWQDRNWPQLGTAVGQRTIHPETLDAISHLRTDLDTFSSKEVDSLACCGYLQMSHQLVEVENLAGLSEAGEPKAYQWPFRRVESDLARGAEDLTEHLRLGRRKFFRFLLGRKKLMNLLAVTLIVLAVGGVTWLFATERLEPGQVLLVAAKLLATAIALAVLAAFILFSVLLVYRVIRNTFGRKE